MMIQKIIVVVQSSAKYRSGATLIEYGLIAATLSVVIIGIETLVGFQLFRVIDSVVNTVSGANDKCGAKRLCGVKLAGGVESTFCPWTE